MAFKGEGFHPSWSLRRGIAIYIWELGAWCTWNERARSKDVRFWKYLEHMDSSHSPRLSPEDDEGFSFVSSSCCPGATQAMSTAPSPSSTRP